VVVVTRNKEITNALLERMGIPFVCLSAPAAGAVGLATELARRWWQVARIIKRERIDVAVSISGISTSLPARLRGIRNVTFTDTEDATLSNRLAFPFTDVIYTPRFFMGDLGKKHVRYDGLHELAYLQGFDFAAARRTRVELGLPERYSIVRLVAYDALHDRDVQGLRGPEVEKLIEHLKPAGEVFVTSQAELPEELRAYRLQTPIEKVHAVLEGASIFVGESPTMAVESGLLGTPAFLVSGRVHRLGNMVGLERDHALLRNLASWSELSAALPAEGSLPALKAEWQARAERYRKSATDMVEFVTQAILGPPRS
jgi:predicted glycosyltransferase